ncbi:MAG TPA: DUF2125 domain-containing protein [Pseudolabrys sp.]|jgi:hypothetical protein|nr:DUF2125 domain-containing protein [Pseudolabrys sp.]
MSDYRQGFQTRRRMGRRYTIGVFSVMALLAGWAWLWHYAAGRTQTVIEGWRVREAKAGRFYACGAQTIGGFPFRFEVNCNKALVQLPHGQPPVEIKAAGALIAAQVYEPTVLTGEFRGPLTIADPGQPPSFIANWTRGGASVSGTPVSPESVSLTFDDAALNRIIGGQQQNYLRAKHVEIDGRMIAGSAAHNPVIEVALKLAATSAPGLHPAAATPIDADITWVLRGLRDFAPKPWRERYRELQAAGGRIDITQARVKQGPTLAVGKGTLSLNANGRLEGQLQVTVAGLEPFLTAIGAQKAVQTSRDMDKVAGALDRLLPGLGNVAREQAAANLSSGINLLGQQTTLEGQQAVTLPLRLSDGAIFLGPIPVGKTPALF